jgi:ribosomal-protein-alanine N-acetyltransferase
MTQLVLPRAFPFADPALPYHIALMCEADVDQIMPIERLSFPAPWPASAYRYELLQNALSSYLVLRDRRSEERPRHRKPRWPGKSAEPALPVVSYGGFWIILDEGHISTIAVHPDWRGQGLGELMLVALMEAAILRGAGELTLEVRVSNLVAQNLYRKAGYVEVGWRKRYYHDNNEDALIMTTPRVDEEAFAAQYAGLKTALHERLIQRFADISLH